MSILNPIQPINLLSNMLYSILDVVSIANIDVLNHIVLSLSKSISEYKERLFEVQNLINSNPDIVQLSGYEDFYENFGSSMDDFEKMIELMEKHQNYSSEFKTLYQEIDEAYTLLVDIIDMVSIKEALYLDKKLA